MNRLIGVLALCWLLVFSLIALLMLLDGEPAPLEAAEAVSLSEPFSLQGTPPDRFLSIGQRLLRVEEEGLAILDAAGKEQFYLAFPYRTSRVTTAGDGLAVVPARGGGMMAIRPDLTALELDTDDAILGASLSSSYILAYGPAAQGKSSLVLLDSGTGAYRSLLSFSQLEWPVASAFLPGGNAFGLLVLDLSSGEAVTRFVRYSLDGSKTPDFSARVEGLLPRLAYIGNQAVLYDDERMVLIDMETGDVREEAVPGRLEVLAAAGGHLAFLTRDGNDYNFHLVRDDAGEGEIFFQPEGYGETIRVFAYASDGSFLLAATEDELVVLDASTGEPSSRQPSGGQVERILALDSLHFFLVIDGQGVIATVG